jgi:alkylation response protein AidB-like acyl-CoA dehydrogenase
LILSRRDLDFLLHEWLDVESLTERSRFTDHSRETFDAVLDLAERIATDHFAPHNRKADENEPRMVDGKVELIPEVSKALKVFADAGLMAGGFDEDLGGMQLPHAVSQAAMAWFQAANIGTCAYPFLTWATPGCCSRTAARSRSTPTCDPSWRAAGSAPWRCRSRRRARHWPTSPRGPSPRTTAPTG